jgi:hypothetical protein
LFCLADGLKDLLSDEHNNAIKTFLLDVCQLMKRLTQLLKKQKYGDAENGEPKAKIMMLLQICATSSTKVLDWIKQVKAT